MLFWLAQTASRFGDPITLIALAAAAFRLTGSALVTGLAVLVATVPQGTVGFFGGAVADALGLRRAMVLCDLARAGLLAMIPLILASGLPLAIAFALVLAAALCASVFNPARAAIMPSLVRPDRLAASNSLVHASDRTIEIVGAAAGGVLVATVGDAVFYVDAATFAVSALLLLGVHVHESPPRPILLRSLWADTVDGLTFIRRHEILFPNTVVSLLAQLSVGVSNGLLPVVIFRRFASSNPDLGARQFGIAEAALALGAVVMGVGYAATAARMAKGRLLIIGWIMYGSLLVAVSLVPDFGSLIVVLILVGMANVLFFIPNVTISQELTPADLRGRVFGARISLLSLSWLPVVVLAGVVGDIADASLLIGLAGAFTVVVALAATRIPAVADVP